MVLEALCNQGVHKDALQPASTTSETNASQRNCKNVAAKMKSRMATISHLLRSINFYLEFTLCKIEIASSRQWKSSSARQQMSAEAFCNSRETDKAESRADMQSSQRRWQRYVR
jgi:hypothetical protein